MGKHEELQSIPDAVRCEGARLQTRGRWAGIPGLGPLGESVWIARILCWRTSTADEPADVYSYVVSTVSRRERSVLEWRQRP